MSGKMNLNKTALQGYRSPNPILAAHKNVHVSLQCSFKYYNLIIVESILSSTILRGHHISNSQISKS